MGDWNDGWDGLEQGFRPHFSVDYHTVGVGNGLYQVVLKPQFYCDLIMVLTNTISKYIHTYSANWVCFGWQDG